MTSGRAPRNDERSGRHPAAIMGRWTRYGAGILTAFVLGAGGLVFLIPESAGAVDAAGAVHNPVLKDPQAIDAGRSIYARRCILCHGNQGGRGPNLFQDTLSDEEFLDTVMSGKTGSRGQMPAWAGTLTESEVWEVEAFVKSTSQFNK